MDIYVERPRKTAEHLGQDSGLEANILTTDHGHMKQEFKPLDCDVRPLGCRWETVLKRVIN